MSETLANKIRNAQTEDVYADSNQRNGYRMHKLAAGLDTINLRTDKLYQRASFPKGLFMRYSQVGRAVIAAISEIVTYKIFTGRVECGAHHPDTELREVPAQFVNEDPGIFFLRVEGESINKIIPDGHLALILPKQKEPNECNLFAVCVNGHDATIKHVNL